MAKLFLDIALIVFLDALKWSKSGDAGNGQVKNKAVSWRSGVTPEGEREVLPLWIANNERPNSGCRS